MTHREAMTSPNGEDWRGLRNGQEPPECEGELVDPNPNQLSSDVYWTIFTCSKCFTVVFTVEGSRHWWNYEGDGSPSRLARIAEMRSERTPTAHQ